MTSIIDRRKMSVHGVADKTVETLKSGKYPFVVLNLANPDMVGHTGKLDKAIEAVGHCDQAIGTIYQACKELGYILFVTADHGNAEKMIDDDGGPCTSHTVIFPIAMLMETAHVPFIMTPTGNEKYEFNIKGSDNPGALRDVAPTVLDVMGIEIPKEMDGESRIKH
jgi:2,3-bisphosphoglycerate-independent phosphoglycerate mutase